MNTLKRTLLASALALLSLPVMADAAHPKIGFSIDDLRLERWSRDRDYFVAAAEKLDAKVFVQSADANEQKQISQIENLISRGVDVIVIVPFNATVLTNAIAEAKKAGIKVVSYDRLILNADIDAYISFDNEKVGEMQASGVLQATMTQQTQKMGRMAVASALDLKAGKAVPKEQLLETVLTTKDNVAPFLQQHP
ncbi:substrate-binding domain-containing protein [Pseudomonas syringae]|uniref:substrate-binding domain-containing protein n=1 Tax=Pseudomonas syringae TaxID=317 RepID=UPI001F9D56E8|nr:substrate-binding domain-containing protein [Pseudomonas syringae]MCF5226326.1 substrate-binding domain-containing protein [Pseudomonas syringae]